MRFARCVFRDGWGDRCQRRPRGGTVLDYHQTAAPRYIPPGGEGVVIVTAVNLGDAPAEGSAARLSCTDLLPAGLTATRVEGTTLLYGGAACTVEGRVTCTFTESLPPYGYLEDADLRDSGQRNHW